MAHPAPALIARAPLDRPAARPLVEKIWEVDAGSHCDLDRCREPWVDLHQVRDAGGVTTELDFGVALEVDLAHERFGLSPYVRRNGDALAQHRVPAHWHAGPPCPLGEARVQVAISVQEAHRLPSSRQ